MHCRSLCFFERIRIVLYVFWGFKCKKNLDPCFGKRSCMEMLLQEKLNGLWYDPFDRFLFFFPFFFSKNTLKIKQTRVFLWE